MNSIVTSNIDKLKDLSSFFTMESKEKFLTLATFKQSVTNTLYELTSTLTEKNLGHNITIYDLLIDLNDKIVKSDFSKKLITEQQKVIKISAIIKSRITLEEKRPSVALKIGFFSDIDAKEYNDFSGKIVIDHIKQSIPFIISRANLLGIDNDDPSRSYKKIHDLVYIAIGYFDQWDVFSSGQMLLFLPKSLLNHLSLQDKLKALDLSSTNTPIKLESLFTWPEKRPMLEDFSSFFSTSVTVPKLFYLIGHGNNTTIGALSGENYQKFILFLKQQNCKALFISSCNSGGLSSLFNFPKEPKFSTESFHEKRTGNSMVTIVNSIGDYKVFNSGISPIYYYDPITKFLENDPQTITALSKRLEKEDKRFTKPWTNSVKVYFPHSHHSYEEFHPINSNYIYSLTHHILFVLKATKSKEIVIKNKLFVTLSPLVINVHLKFIHNDAILLSMVPGKAHHYIETISLDIIEPLQFLQKQMDNFELADKVQNKIFYIKTIRSSLFNIHQVILILNEYVSLAYYTRNNKNYFFNGKTSIEVSSFECTLLKRMSYFLGIPYRIALSMHPGGDFNEDLFFYKIDKFYPLSELDVKYREILEYKDDLKLIDLLKSFAIESPSDFEKYIFYLLKSYDYTFVLKIFQNINFNPNMKDRNGNALIFFCYNHYEILKLLISINVDVNVEFIDYCLLDVILCDNIKNNFILIIDHLNFNLEYFIKKNILDNLFTNSPEDCVYYVKEILKKGDFINLISKSKQTMLNFAIQNINIPLVDYLLENGANPNLGTPNPIFTAIKQQDYDLISKLIKFGADPFKNNDQSNKIPFIEACFRAPIEIVNLLMSSQHCDVTVEDSSGMNPLLAALISNDQEKINLLKSKDAKLPLFIKKQSLSIQTVIIRSIYLKNYTLIKEMLLDDETCDILKKVLNNTYIIQSAYFSILLDSHTLLNHPPFIKLILDIVKDNIPFIEKIIEKNIQIADARYLIPYLNNLLALKNYTRFKILYNKYFLFNKLHYHFLKEILSNDLNLEAIEIFKWIAEKVNFHLLDVMEEVIIKGNQELLDFSLQHEQNISDELLFCAAKNCHQIRGYAFKKLIETHKLDMNKTLDLKVSSFDLLCLNTTSISLFIWALKMNPIVRTLKYVCKNKNDKDFIMLKILIEKGFSLDLEPITQMTNYDEIPFNAIICSGSLTNVKWALENRAVINPKNVSITPLQLSCKLINTSGHQIFEELILNGADINGLGQLNTMPVILEIIKRKNLTFIQFCFEKGAKLDTLKHRQIALTHALMTGNFEIINFILNHIDIQETAFFNLKNLLFWTYKYSIETGHKILPENLNLSYLSLDCRQVFWKLLIQKPSDYSILTYNKSLKAHLENDSELIINIILKYNGYSFLNFIYQNKIKFPVMISIESIIYLIEKDQINLIELLYKMKLLSYKLFFHCRYTFIFSPKMMRWLLELGFKKEHIQNLIIEENVLTTAIINQRIELVVFCLEICKECVKELYEIGDDFHTLLDFVKIKNDPKMIEILKEYF